MYTYNNGRNKKYIYIGGMYIYTDTFVYVEYMYNSGSI